MRVIVTVTVARLERVIRRVRLAPDSERLRWLIAARGGRGIGAAEAEDQSPTVADATTASITPRALKRAARVFTCKDLQREEIQLPTGDRPCI